MGIPSEISSAVSAFGTSISAVSADPPKFLMSNLIILCSVIPKYFDRFFYFPANREKFREGLEKYKIKGKVISQKDDSELMPYIYSLTKLALCKSGTVNMELALYGIPQIVGYRVSRVTSFIAKKILNFKVKFISPVNLLLKKSVVPEFVQKNFNENIIFYKACRLLDLSSEKARIKKGYTLLKKELGEEGVVKRAAKEIINSII